MESKKPSPGYLWSPGSSPENNPLQIVVAVVIGSILIGVLLLALLT